MPSEPSTLYRFASLRWSDARAISRWHYDGVYAFYDQDILPMLSLALFRSSLRMLGLEAFVVLSDVDEANERIGIFTFIQRGGVIEIGLAMRPDLTGRGLGL